MKTPENFDYTTIEDLLFMATNILKTEDTVASMQLDCGYNKRNVFIYFS